MYICRGAFAGCQGPLDAQCRLLDLMVVELTYDSVDVSNAISVIESITALVHQHISLHERVHTRSASDASSLGGAAAGGSAARLCFGSLFSGIIRGNASSNSDSNRDSLMCHLLKLLNVLVQIPMPNRGARSRTTSNAGSAASSAAAADAGGSSLANTSDSPMTDMSKISQQQQQASVRSSTEEHGQQTDEQKTETAAAAAAAAAAATKGGRSSSPASIRNRSTSKPRACTHFSDPRHPEQEVKEATLTDVILGHPHIMVHLLQALSLCHSHSIASLLGSSATSPTSASNSSSSMCLSTMHDTFANMDPQSVGDGIFHVLCTLNKKASDVKLVLRAMYTYISAGFQGTRAAGISKLSEPLLWFILRLLDCEVAIKLFLEMGKFFQLSSSIELI